MKRSLISFWNMAETLTRRDRARLELKAGNLPLLVDVDIDALPFNGIEPFRW